MIDTKVRRLNNPMAYKLVEEDEIKVIDRTVLLGAGHLELLPMRTIRELPRGNSVHDLLLDKKSQGISGPRETERGQQTKTTIETETRRTAEAATAINTTIVMSDMESRHMIDKHRLAVPTETTTRGSQAATTT